MGEEGDAGGGGGGRGYYSLSVIVLYIFAADIWLAVIPTWTDFQGRHSLKQRRTRRGIFATTKRSGHWSKRPPASCGSSTGMVRASTTESIILDCPLGLPTVTPHLPLPLTREQGGGACWGRWAPQVTSPPIPYIFLCSPVPFGSWRTPGLSIP